MKVLICCECSGEIRRAFERLGHQAWSVDLKASEDGSRNHIIGDALAAIRRGCPQGVNSWDIIIAHPPCPRLSLSGALRLYVDGKKENGRDPAKFREMRTAATFFRSFFVMADQQGAKLAVENPRQHGHALRAHGMGPPSQTIQPHQFGEDASKATCLWLRGLLPLIPTHIADDMFAAQPPSPSHRRRPSALRESDGQRAKQTPAELASIGRSRADLFGDRGRDGGAMGEPLMKCVAILRKSPHAGGRCPNTATRGAWCAVHDPAIVLPRLRGKRDGILKSLSIVEAAIVAAEKEQEPEGNPS